MTACGVLMRVKDDVLRVYETLDAEIEKFKTLSALSCVQGCGRCCENPNVYVTVLEVLPLAFELWHRRTAQEVLDNIAQDPLKRVCVFYKPDPSTEGQGRCGIYLWRPLICRLFGFSAKKDKNSCQQLVTCPTIKKQRVAEYRQAVKNLSQQKWAAPLMQDYAMRIFNIDPHLGQEQLPINQAVKIALEKVGWLHAQEKI